MKIGSSKKYSTGMNLEFSVKRKSKLWVDLSSGDVNIFEKETSGMKSEFPFVIIFSILLESSKVCKTFRSKFSSIGRGYREENKEKKIRYIIILSLELQLSGIWGDV